MYTYSFDFKYHYVLSCCNVPSCLIFLGEALWLGFTCSLNLVYVFDQIYQYFNNMFKESYHAML